MHEPLQPPTQPNTTAHPILTLAAAWLFVFTAVLAALRVWFG
jgi:hypothetical protein